MNAASDVRPVGAGDGDRLATLHAAAFGGAAWSAAQLAESLAAPACYGYVAVNDGEAAGFILCQMALDEAEILTFCTAPGMRRQGIGHALLDTALRHADAHGVMRIFLEVAANNDAARALYEQAGFQVAGLRRGYYSRGDSREDAVMMERRVVAFGEG